MVIFRVISNLTRLGIRLALFPIFLLTRNLFLVVIVVAAVLIYTALGTSSGSNRTASQRDANPVRMERNAQGQMVQVASPVRTTEDGNSAFANDLYAQMTDEERSAYSQTFFWAMASLKDGASHQWAHTDIAGTLTPTNSYKNKVGATCRNFNETLKVHSVQQQLQGIACQKNDGSWCKLKANATPVCGIGHNPGMLENFGTSLKNMF